MEGRKMAPEFVRAIAECIATLGWVAGAMGEQPNFSLCEGPYPEEVRQDMLKLYLDNYREGLALADQQAVIDKLRRIAWLTRQEKFGDARELAIEFFESAR
jgi:hypothetical protein